MKMQHAKSPQKGQSIAEYVLLLALVAIVAVAILFGVGLATQRIYGLIEGAFGVHFDTHDKHIVEITSAQCISVASIHQTGLWVVGNTDEDIADLTGSTEFGLSEVSANGSGFLYHPMIDANAADVTKCPESVVIQAKDGAIAIVPLVKVSQ